MVVAFGRSTAPSQYKTARPVGHVAMGTETKQWSSWLGVVLQTFKVSTWEAQADGL